MSLKAHILANSSHECCKGSGAVATLSIHRGFHVASYSIIKTHGRLVIDVFLVSNLQEHYQKEMGEESKELVMPTFN